MKTALRLFLLIFLALVPLVFPMDAGAGMLFVESGRGFYFSNNATAVIIRGRIDCADLFSFKSFCEVEFASWNGRNENEAIGLSRGIKWQAGEHGFGTISAGLSHIDRTTSTLGQPFEFFGRLAYDREVGPTVVSLGWIHISDAKFLFGWSGRNDSENFWTLSVGVPF